MATDLVVTNNPTDFTTINRNSPFTVRWTGGDTSTILSISGISIDSSLTSGTVFVCIANVSAGQFTVPVSILSQLTASPSTSGGGISFIIRGTFSVGANGAGTRFSTPAGLDILTGNNSWSWTYTPQYR